MHSRSVAQRIEAYNRGRAPELVARKLGAMSKDPFVFFRGTAHLFWEDWATIGSALDDAPLVWCCGDLHLENFGSYRGDNGLTYFDLNDFDEGALAPATRDVARLLTSLHLGAASLRLDSASVDTLEATCLDAYLGTLASGKARWIERRTARGMVRDLLRAGRSRTQRRLLADRTTTKGGHARIKIRKDHTFALSPHERKRARACVAAFATAQPNAEFYRVLDVAGRIAGTGSLGFERYVALIRGPGGARHRRLLDIKEAHRSALAVYMSATLAARQPRWRNAAERVITVQRQLQAIAPSLLGTAVVGKTSFVIRELQPSEDRLALDQSRRLGRLRNALTDMAQLIGWAQLRGASRQGTATLDALVDFARARTIRRDLIRFARDYAERARADWEEFAVALWAGAE